MQSGQRSRLTPQVPHEKWQARRALRAGLRLCAAALAALPFSFSAFAQAPAVPNTANTAPPPMSLTDQIIRGRVQLEAGNTQAIATLQAAAQQSLTPLINVAGPEILTKDPQAMPQNPAFNLILRQAAEAHYWWGVAADRFGSRDVALTAFARAARFFAGDKSNTYSAAREALANLKGSLTEGLPLVAPDDTIETIATIAHGGFWKPLRLKFRINASTLSLSSPPGAAIESEFLLTDGKLFIPPKSGTRDPRGKLSQVPPPFRAIPAELLPRSLNLSNVVYGYARETEGANRGMWKQVVRVYYAHSAVTAKNRDDRPRASALCLQFLKIHALNRVALGLENPYTERSFMLKGVTTIWLSEMSALWPSDEDDPAVLASLGIIYMPKANIPSVVKPGDPIEIKGAPLERAWLAAGQSEDEPGEIVFFKMAEPRSEAEWARELAHEYGHVTLPPFNGFRPPLEPYGNGTLGETLGMMWMGGAPSEFSSPLREITEAQSRRAGLNLTSDGAAADAVTQEFNNIVLTHVNNNALSALGVWNVQGPGSPLRRDPTVAGLQYLQGLVTHIERVYGAPLLAASFSTLPRIAEAPLAAVPATTAPGSEFGAAATGVTGSTAIGAAGTPVLLPVPTPPPPPALQAPALLDGFTAALKEPFAENQTRLPIWLPGALNMPQTKLTAPDLIARAPLGLKAGERATCWLFVPANAAALHISWKGAATTTMAVDGGWKSTPAAPSSVGATGAVRIETGNRSGWQRFAFTPSADITWSGAWFEKSNLPALPPAPKT
jgi:hypothetical protein